MFLVEAGAKLQICGVSYGPFRPNDAGEPYPDKSVVERDFALLRDLGANTLRVYHVPPPWVRELAAAFALRLLVGVPWEQHVRFLDSPQRRAEITARIRDAAEELRETPNVLGLLLGNEISPQVVRWYGPTRVERFLGELADAAHEADPDLLVSYASFPMTEYLDLGFADFVCFNVYLHQREVLSRYLARLQNIAGARPLVLSEFGADSMREGEAEQARILADSASAAAELGCAGSIVFSYTDEWYTGGHEIEDWAFGLVTRDREPKPAYHAVQEVFQATAPRWAESPPRVSVIVCAYNAESTMEECLDSLRELDYADYEVIVVNDGSSDGTKAIAERYPEFRLITDENRGLSAARNEGITAATGEIVAYTDSDCAADPQWLTFLVKRLLSEDFAGVGGPNLPPPEDDWVPEVVARSPGGPTHVLLTDWEAEHVPGCNMAFWRRELLTAGMFDPVFRTAGDDVDLCWRLQNEGRRIGFAAAALVWHRRRNTVSAYLKQQQGYGTAEALLAFKHPYRFNRLGHSRWFGRIYADFGPGVLGARPVVYGGPLGEGFFQTLYEPPSSLLRHLPVTLEWTAAAASLLALGVIATVFSLPFQVGFLAGLGMFAVTAAHCTRAAMQVNVDGLPRWRARGLVGVLTWAGPVVRGFARISGRIRGLSEREPVLSADPTAVEAGRRWTLSFWNETSLEKGAVLSALMDFFQPRKYPLVLDDGWQPWDAAIHSGPWVRGEIKILIENHGAEKRLVNVGLRLHSTGLARLVVIGFAVPALLAAAAGSASGALLLGATALGVAGWLARQMRGLSRSIHHGVTVAFAHLPVSLLREGETGTEQSPE
jgi:glycosyltransferase involved in cell wall biosynthesis